MTDRHIHCIFCLKCKDNEECCKCLKTNQIFYPLHGDPSKGQKGWFEPHCEHFIPNPRLLLTYFIYHFNFIDVFEIADIEQKKTLTVSEKMDECVKLADKFLNKYGWGDNYEI